MLCLPSDKRKMSFPIPPPERSRRENLWRGQPRQIDTSFARTYVDNDVMKRQRAQQAMQQAERSILSGITTPPPERHVGKRNIAEPTRKIRSPRKKTVDVHLPPLNLLDNPTLRRQLYPDDCGMVKRPLVERTNDLFVQQTTNVHFSTQKPLRTGKRMLEDERRAQEERCKTGKGDLSLSRLGVKMFAAPEPIANANLVPGMGKMGMTSPAEGRTGKKAVPAEPPYYDPLHFKAMYGDPPIRV